MADKKKPEEKDAEVVIESAIGRTEAWLQRNSKVLLTALAVIVVVVGVYFAYQYLYKAPRQEKAAAAMYQAQQAFTNEDYALALNGDGNTIGFLQIIERYGGTASGNLACHYAGQCYLQQADYSNAISYFDRYKTVAGVPAALVNAVNAGLTGDAHAQLGELAKAAAAYEKAVGAGDDPLTTPYYGRKAGDAYAGLGEYRKALELYRMVKDRFPSVRDVIEIDKAIAQVEQKL